MVFSRAESDSMAVSYASVFKTVVLTTENQGFGHGKRGYRVGSSCHKCSDDETVYVGNTFFWTF